MDVVSLTNRLTVEEAEASHMVTNDRLGPYPVPFGFVNARWKQFVSRIIPGDELWEFTSSPQSWEDLMGRAGIALVRHGEIVDEIISRMN